jgi:DNA-binding NarL/FixJ family response regulator
VGSLAHPLNLSPRDFGPGQGRSFRPSPFPPLTPREHDVLRLVAQGLSNSAIADRLGLSLKTVNNNTSSIFTRLNVGTRTEAAILARDRGLTRPDQRSTERTADS